MSVTFVSRPVSTIHFIGVSTKQSSIMHVFPEWAKELDLGDVAINGIDLPLHATPDQYQQVVNFIRDDANSNGALVTTHKIDLFKAAHSLFDELDWFAASMHEISSISKRAGQLIGQAKDPVSAGRALKEMIRPGFWPGEGGDVFCMGCGGAGVAITWFLLRGEHLLGKPERLIVSDTSPERLVHLRELVDVDGLEIELVQNPKDNDRIIQGLKAGSFVINATGLGKDRPGSPITDNGRFPRRAIVWELNYRGALDFLHQAKRVAAEQELTVHDGWDYFVHGWSCVIADVFHVDISNERVSKLAEIAARVSGRK
jgi:shikimate dehydrogenase